MSDEQLSPVRWRDWTLPIIVGFMVGVTLAPLVRALIALLVISFR